jgi:hypothetical protein
MQRAEMEELRQREANLTALQAIGPRKKPKLELNGSPSSSGQVNKYIIRQYYVGCTCNQPSFTVISSLASGLYNLISVNHESSMIINMHYSPNYSLHNLSHLKYYKMMQ